jgi:hypothetical protein
MEMLKALAVRWRREEVGVGGFRKESRRSIPRLMNFFTKWTQAIVVIEGWDYVCSGGGGCVCMNK